MTLARSISRFRYTPAVNLTATAVCLAAVCLAAGAAGYPAAALVLLALLALATGGELISRRATVPAFVQRGLAGLLFVIVAVDNAFAQTTVDPAAPLTMLQTARSSAAQSNLSTTSLSTTGNNVVGLICIAGGVIGVGTALISGYKLYDNVSQGEQARGSNMGYFVALIIGSLLSIIALIVGVVTSYATGTA